VLARVNFNVTKNDSEVLKPSPDIKSKLSGNGLLNYLDVDDVRVRRSGETPIDNSFNRCAISFDYNLNSTVDQISYPSVDTLIHRKTTSAVPEINSLNSTCNK
jgi:hypothetical protein